MITFVHLFEFHIFKILQLLADISLPRVEMHPVEVG